MAVGRLRRGPDLELISDYLERFNKTGRQLSLGPAEVVEVEDRKNGGKPGEAPLLLKAIPDGAHVIALEERGRVMSSPDFANQVARVRDGGSQDLCFVIGGADGLDPSVTQRADQLLSFGPMVWPHMLARVMLTEQLYRAASILAGSPYHRV